MLVRFEDIAMYPSSKFQKIFKFLQIPFTKETKHFLWIHTKNFDRGEQEDVYSIKRSSNTIPEAWKKILPLHKVKTIQKHCKFVLSQLGYALL